MEKSFPFNAVTVDGIPDRVYAAEDFAAERAAYVSNGVTADGALAVSPSASGGMAVDIAAGIAVIDGYTYFNTSPLTLAVAAADASLPRIDLAVLRLDLDARRMYCRMIGGIPAATPAVPAVIWNETVREMPLAQIRIPARTADAATAVFTDVRVRADYILNRLDVEEILGRYETAIADFFDVEDAASLAKSASVVKTDAGAGAVLCGDGTYRNASQIGEKREELVRFTSSGVFNPAAYPTKDGKYDVIIQGAGGSGAWAPESANPYGGEAGGIRVLSGLPLLAGMTYTVTVGVGGAGVNASIGNSAAVGKRGGASSFAGFSAPGGQGGDYGATLTSPGTPTCENGYTHNMGTAGSSGKGGDSLLAAGGKNNLNGHGGGGSLGSGGGAADKKNTDYTYYSGKGGDGVVIICGVRA